MEISADDELYVAVHDGARPLITPSMISRGWECALRNDSAIPSIPLSDSIRHLSGQGESHSVARKDYVAVQTPQIFKSEIIKRAYAQPESADFTDDASVVEALGLKVSLYDGEPDNIKITYPRDLQVACIIMNSQPQP